MLINKYSFRLLFSFIFLLIFCITVSAKNVEKERKKVLERKEEVLDHLYRIRPNAKKEVQNAAGYAVFSNFGLKIFLAGGGKGKGVAVNNKTGKKTFMKMIEIQAGLGIGVKKFSQVWIFEYTHDLNQFINSGWELSAEGTAAAKVEDKGGDFSGALSVKPGVWLYQLTEEGLALQLTGKGTKYYKDGDLN